MLNKFILFSCFILFGFLAQAQEEQQDSTTSEEDDDFSLVIPALNEKTKIGIKIGLGMATMIGEDNNPRPISNLSGGVYYRYRFARHWSLQPELNVSFRGSNFDNATDQYGTIRAYYMDIPLLIMFGVNEKNTSNIVLGPQYSRLLNSSIYKKKSAVPESSAPSLNPNDILAVAGMQFQTPFVGFQLLLKYGFLNLKQGGSLTDLPPSSTGKEMHNISLEVNFIF